MKRTAAQFFQAARALDRMARANPKRGMIFITAARRFRMVGRIKLKKEMAEKPPYQP